MSNKQNQVFQKATSPTPTDPIKAAQGLSGDQAEGSLESLAVNAVAIAPTEGVVEQPVQDQEVVQDTTAAKPVDQTQHVNARAGYSQNKHQQNNTVQRPVGASTREASPTSAPSSKQAVVSNDFQSMMASEKQKGSVHSIGLILFLESYVRDMVPGKPTKDSEVLKYQEGLHDQLVTIIERAPAKDFKRLWNTAIAFFGMYKEAAFSPRYYSRGAKEWKRDPQQFTTLTNLLNLLEASAADISTVNSQVNVNTVMGKGFSEEGRGRMIAFYLK